jgi:flagellin-like hook-associated protein FlgL
MLGGSEQLAKSTSLYMESAHRNLSRGLNRLSTGVKLSSGVDDAGGLGVSMNIGAKLKKAFKVRENVQNARSFLEHQEAALSSMGKALDRMAELRTKYDDLVAGRPERELYNKEFKEMQAEMLSMRGRKFNGVSIFSTNPKDPLSFYIPTSDDGISTQVAINRTGFFDSLTIGSSTPGSTPATTFNGVTGSFAGSVQGNAGGAVSSFLRTPTSGLHATPIDFTVTAGGTVAPFPATPLIGASPAVGITVAAGGTVTPFPATPVKGSHTAIPVTVVEGTATTVTATALQGTGSLTENVTAFAGEDISIATTVVAGGNAAEIPAWVANPVNPAGNISQQGVTDGSGNLWFVTDSGVVQKVEAGDPAAAGTGPLTMNGAETQIPDANYVSKPIILNLGGQEHLFVATQNTGTNNAALHKINLATGVRTQFTSITGGQETLKGLSEDSGMLHIVYSRTAGFGVTEGSIARVDPNTLTLDNSFSGDGRVTLPNFLGFLPRDFGPGAGEAKVDLAFNAGNLYTIADQGSRTRLISFDANGNSNGHFNFGPNNFVGGVSGNQAHSPVIDGGNVYAALDSTTLGAPGRITARQLNGAAIAGWSDINLPGSERVIQNPVINGAHLYFSTDQGNVYKYDKATGAQVGNFSSGSGAAMTMPVFDGTDVFVGQQNGSLHKLDATMSRDASWPGPGVTAAGSIGAPPLVVGTEVYVGSPGRVQGFEAPVPGRTILDQNVAPPHDYSTTHTPGDNIAVTVETTGGILTKWEGTAEVQANGSLNLKNFAVNAGSAATITDLTLHANVIVVTPAIAPTLPASVSFGTNYLAGENPTVTVTKPNTTTQNLAAADVTNNGDGTLTVSLANVVMAGTGSYNITSSAGSRYLQTTTFNNQGTIGAYPATETPDLKSVTDAGAVAVTGVTATAVAQPNGQLNVVLAGTPSATGTLTLTFDGPLTATPTTTLANVGTNYAPGEGVLVNTNIPEQGGGGNFLTATATNNGNGTLTISALNGIPASSSNLTAGFYNVTADPGVTLHLPNEHRTLLTGLTGSYGDGEVVGVSLIDTGTGAVPQEAPVPPALTGPDITASGIGQSDGSVIITFSGTPTSPSPITVTVDPGSLTAAPTTPGSLSGIGTGYATGEAVAANVTGVAGMTTTVANNGNGTLDIVLGAVPAGTPPGTYQVQANPGTMFQLADENIAANLGTSYGNGEVVTVTLTDQNTGVAPAGGLSASGIGQGDGSLQITFTNSPTSADDILIAPATGFPNLAQTSLSNVGSGYDPAEPLPTITVTDPGGTDVTGTASVTGINAADGSLNIDLTGVTLTAASPTGPYAIATSNGTIASIPTVLNGIGSGYSPAEPAPTVTVTDPASTALTGATASINANGTISINLAGVAATTAGPYTVNATGGTVSGVQQGLDDTNKDLWDFSHADFEKFIQTLTDVIAVNGATTSSLAFSESRLETNIQNLELAGGRIVDADMAEEMVEVAKSQILLQTATDSLSKHNKLSVRVDKTLMGLSGGM